MGMFSEITASHEALKLKKILLKAIATSNQYVIDFCCDNVVPLYISASDEAFENVDKELLKQFELKKD